MIGIAPDLSASSVEAAAQYWRESVSPERKALFEANLHRLPDVITVSVILSSNDWDNQGNCP